MTISEKAKDILEKIVRARRGRYRNDVERNEVMAIVIEDSLMELLEAMAADAELTGSGKS